MGKWIFNACILAVIVISLGGPVNTGFNMMHLVGASTWLIGMCAHYILKLFFKAVSEDY